MIRDKVNSNESVSIELSNGNSLMSEAPNYGLKATGSVHFAFKDENGNVIAEVERKNLVVSAGLAFITSRMINASAPVMSHMGLGSNTAAAAAANIALGAELGRSALASSTQVTTNVANDSVQYVASFPAGIATGAVTEAALLNAATNGTMLARTVFPVVNKGVLDSVTVTWKVTLA